MVFKFDEIDSLRIYLISSAFVDVGQGIDTIRSEHIQLLFGSSEKNLIFERNASHQLQIEDNTISLNLPLPLSGLQTSFISLVINFERSECDEKELKKEKEGESIGEISFDIKVRENGKSALLSSPLPPLSDERFLHSLFENVISPSSSSILCALSCYYIQLCFASFPYFFEKECFQRYFFEKSFLDKAFLISETNLFSILWNTLTLYEMVAFYFTIIGSLI